MGCLLVHCLQQLMQLCVACDAPPNASGYPSRSVAGNLWCSTSHAQFSKAGVVRRHKFPRNFELELSMVCLCDLLSASADLGFLFKCILFYSCQASHAMLVGQSLRAKFFPPWTVVLSHPWEEFLSSCSLCSLVLTGESARALLAPTSDVCLLAMPHPMFVGTQSKYWRTFVFLYTYICFAYEPFYCFGAPMISMQNEVIFFWVCQHQFVRKNNNKKKHWNCLFLYASKRVVVPRLNNFCA